MTFIFESNIVLPNYIVHQEWVSVFSRFLLKNTLFLEEQLSERLPKRLAPYFKGIS